MRKTLGLHLIFGGCFLVFGPCVAGSPQEICKIHSLIVEKDHGIPGSLLHSISKVETGYKESAWPWAVNVGGESHYFETKAEAVQKVKKLMRQGVENIDVGCMQINVKHHADNFASISEMIDPKKNIEYAAKFLKKLKAKYHSWTRAVGFYHSATRKVQVPYRKKVYHAWMKERAAISQEHRRTLSERYALRGENRKMAGIRHKNEMRQISRSKIKTSQPHRVDLARFRNNVLSARMKNESGMSNSSRQRSFKFMPRPQSLHSLPRLSMLANIPSSSRAKMSSRNNEGSTLG